MAVELASAYVSIIPTTKGIAANLERELTGPLNDAAKKAGDQAGKTLKMSMDKAGQTFTKFGVGALAVSGAVGIGLYKVGTAASDLHESINAVQVTFGSAANGILKLGKDAAKAVGLSNAEFNSLAVSFSSFASSVAGKNGDIVATMDTLTTRVADFASVMNLDVPQAAIIFRSALAGESEPIRRFGIDLSEAAISAYAAANGIAASSEELTLAEKVQIRYALVMEQTDKVQGDFANTSDAAANSMRIASAEMKNAAASAGASLAPAMATVAQIVASGAEKFSALNDATDGWLAKGVGIATVALGVAGGMSFVVGQALKMQTRMGDLRDAFATLRGSMTNAEGGLTRMGKAASVAGPLLVVAGIAAVGLGLRARSQAAHIREMADAIGELSRVADKEVIGVMVKALAEGAIAGKSAAESFKEMAHANLEGAKRALEMAEAQGLSEKVTTALRRAIVDETRAVEEAGAAHGRLSTEIDDTTDSLDPAAIGTDVLTAATEGFTKATDEAKRKSEAFTDSLERQRSKTDELFGIERSAVDAKYAFAESSRQAMVDTDLLNQALASGKTSQEDLTTATDNAKSSILKASEDYATLKGAALDSEGGILRQIESLKLQAQSLAPGSPLRVFLEGYIKDLETIPSNISTILDLNISMGAVTTKVGDIPIGLRFGRAAAGGWHSGPTVVGEDGPELLNLPRNTYVNTAAATRSLLAGGLAGAGGGAVTPIIVNNYRRDIGVADMNQVLAMARLAS